MALSGREIMLVLRARDEASRTLRRISRTMNATQRATHRDAMSNVRQQEAALSAMTGHRRQLVRANQDNITSLQRQRMEGKLTQKQYQRAMLEQRTLHRNNMRAWENDQESAIKERQRFLDRARAVELADAAKRERAYARMDAGAALTTVGVGMTATGLGGLSFMKGNLDATKAYREESMKTYTQVDILGAKLKDVEKIGLDVAKKVPVAFEEIQPALYDIFSSIDVSVKGADKLLHQLARDAVGGATDVQTATRATLTIMNAYKLGVEDVSKVSDFMFQLVRKGVGTYDEFAKTIGYSIPSAARAGQTYEQLGGMLAFMTRNGLSASRASTSAGRALDAMSHPKTVEKLEEMGVAAKDASGEFRPMTDIVQDLAKKLEGLSNPEKTKALYELFKGSGGTIQARRFFDAVLKGPENLKSYVKLTKQMENAGGAAAQAYDKMKDTPQAELNQLNNNIKVLRIEAGKHLLPVLIKFVKAVNSILDAWQKLSPQTRKFITLAVAVASALLVVVGVITTFVGLMLMASGALTLAGTSLAFVLGISAAVVAGIAAIAAAGYLIYKNWDKISKILQPVWDMLKSGASTVAGYFKSNFLPVLKDIGDFFVDVWQGGIVPAFQAVVDYMSGTAGPAMANTFQKIGDAGKWLWDNALQPIFAIWVDFLKSIMGPAMMWFWKNVVQTAFKGIVQLAKWWWQITKAIFNLLVDAVRNYLGPAIEWLWKNIFKPAFKGIADVAKWLWKNVLKPTFEALKYMLTNVLIPVIKALYSDVFKPVFKLIEVVIKTFWGIGKVIFQAFVWYFKNVFGPSVHWLWDNAFKPVFHFIGDVIKWLWNNITKPIFTFIGNHIKNVWEGVIKPALNAFVDFMRNYVAPAFKKAVDAIGRAWSGLKKLISVPVNFVIGVYNKGIVPLVNGAYKFFGGKGDALSKISPVGTGGGGGGGAANPGGAAAQGKNALAGMARGGVMPGYTPGRDVMTAAVSGGEAIMRPEWTRAMGVDNIHRWNAIARRSGVAGVRRALEGGMGAYAKGGVVWPTTFRSLSPNYPGHTGVDISLPGSADLGKPVFATAAGLARAYWAGANSYGNLVRINHGSYETLYGHLLRQGRSGQVKAGQQIGNIGSTGNSSGPHLHFEIRPGATREAALAYLNGAGAPTGGGALGVITAIPDFLGKLAGIAKKLADVGGTPFAQKIAGGAGRYVVGQAKDWLESKVAQFNPALGLVGKIASKVGGNLFGKASGLATRMFGWSGNQLTALRELVSKESSWNPTAKNPTSTAYGLFQFLDSTWASTGIKKTSNPILQTVAGLRYIRQRYGSPLAALKFHNSHNWYDNGGMLQPGTSIVTNKTGKPEPVFNPDQWKNIKSGMQAFAKGGIVRKFQDMGGPTWDPRRHPRDPKTGHFISWTKAAAMGIKWVAKARQWKDLGPAYNLRKYLTKLFGTKVANDILGTTNPDRDTTSGERGSSSSGSGSGSGGDGDGTAGEKKKQLTPAQKRKQRQNREHLINIRTAKAVKSVLEDMNNLKPKGTIKAIAEIFDKKVGWRKVNKMKKNFEDEFKQLNKVIDRYQKLTKKLDAAREKLAALRDERNSYRDSVRDSILDFGSLQSAGERTDVFGNQLPINATSIAAGLQDRLRTIQEWGTNLQQLMQMGFSKNVYDQVVQMGPEQGSIYAKALVAATPQQVQQINTLASQITTSANAIAKTAADELYLAGIKAAEGLVEGLKARRGAVRDAAERLARILVRSIKRELGIKSPSKVAIDLATNFGQTYAKTLAGHSKAVGLAAKQMAGQELNRGLTRAMTRAPVGSAPGGSASVTHVNQDITINTNEIDPRRTGAQLGWALIERYRV